MKILHTNKMLAIFTPKEAYYQLLLESKESLGYTKEFILQNSGYYLIDQNSGHFNPDMKEISSVFSRAFESELSESGVPKENWPNTKDFDEFQKYFTITIRALIADLGKNELVTGESNV